MNVPEVKDIITRPGNPASDMRGPVLLALIVLLLGLPWTQWLPLHDRERSTFHEGRSRIELRCPDTAAGIYEADRGTTVGAFLVSVGMAQTERSIEEGIRNRPLFDLCALEKVHGRWRMTDMTPATRFLLGEPMDLNRADGSALELLPRIGPVLARRIVKYRDRHGPFGGADDLVLIHGISTKTLERLLPFVTVDPKEAMQ